MARLLSAWIGGFDLAQSGGGIVPVEPVQEDDARLAVLPSQIDDEIEDLASVQPPHLREITGVAQRIVVTGEDRPHELLGDTHRDVEVVEDMLVLFGPYELHDVGVIDPQDAHVRAPARAPLLDGLGGHIEYTHERHRSTRHSHGGADQIVLGPEPAETESRSPARLMHQSCVADGAEDGIHAVLDRENEAGG